MDTEFIMLKAQVEAFRNYFTSLLPTIFQNDREKDRISRRRHQLQVLMDVAYIQGRLEEYGITRKVDSYAASQAEQVYAQSDHSEETMLPLIDAL